MELFLFRVTATANTSCRNSFSGKKILSFLKVAMVMPAPAALTLLEYADPGFTHCCCAVGTGTMMAGLIRAARLRPGCWYQRDEKQPGTGTGYSESAPRQKGTTGNSCTITISVVMPVLARSPSFHGGTVSQNRNTTWVLSIQPNWSFGVNDLLQRGFPVGSRILVIHRVDYKVTDHSMEMT